MTDESSNAMLTAALAYADRGWRVLPLHSRQEGACSCRTACKSPAKHPRTPHGLTEATTDPATIRSWWARWPDANIGVATGSGSGLYVIDLDARRSVDLGTGVVLPEGEHSLRVVEAQLGQTLPETLTARTGSGGLHLCFRYPADGRVHGNRAGLLPSVDVRGEGGYIVAPPSTNIAGRPYAWLDPAEPLAALPAWWGTIGDSVAVSSPLSQESVGEGGRNDYLYRYACRLVGEGWGGEELTARVWAQNLAVCTPPLDPAEVRQVVESASRFPPEAAKPSILIFDGGTDLPELGEDGLDLARSWDDFAAHPPEPRTPVVGQGLLDRKDGFILAGQSGVGKSWLVFDLAVSVALGQPWLGEFPTVQGPVLLVDQEGGNRGLYERIAALLEGRGESGHGMPLYLQVEQELKLDDPRGYLALQRMCERHRPAVVILDAMKRFHTGDENSSQAMSAFFARCMALKNTYECALVMIHHIRKPAKEDAGDLADLMRGSSDIRAWPDGIVIAQSRDLVRPPGELLAGQERGVKLTHKKSRNHPELPPFDVRLAWTPEVARVQYEGGAIPSRLPREVSPAACLAVITELADQEGAALPGRIAARMGRSVTTVEGYLKALKEDGLIRTKVVGGGAGVIPAAHQRGFSWSTSASSSGSASFRPSSTG